MGFIILKLFYHFKWNNYDRDFWINVLSPWVVMYQEFSEKINMKQVILKNKGKMWFCNLFFFLFLNIEVYFYGISSLEK